MHKHCNCHWSNTFWDWCNKNIFPFAFFNISHGGYSIVNKQVLCGKKNRRREAPVGALRSGDLGEIRPWI